MTDERAIPDPEGYCNALLVTMARTRTPRVTLAVGQPVPHLEALAHSRADTLQWVRDQFFAFEEIDASEVVETLMITAGMRRWPFASKRGTIHAVDLEGDFVEPVDRVYGLQVEGKGDRMQLHVTFEG